MSGLLASALQRRVALFPADRRDEVSAEERDKILRDIDGLFAIGRRGTAEPGKSRKRGIRLPIVVNAAAAALFCSAVFVFELPFNAEKEGATAAEGGRENTALHILDQMKARAQALAAEKDRRIASIRAELALLRSGLRPASEPFPSEKMMALESDLASLRSSEANRIQNALHDRERETFLLGQLGALYSLARTAIAAEDLGAAGARLAAAEPILERLTDADGKSGVLQTTLREIQTASIKSLELAARNRETTDRRGEDAADHDARIAAGETAIANLRLLQAERDAVVHSAALNVAAALGRAKRTMDSSLVPGPSSETVQRHLTTKMLLREIAESGDVRHAHPTLYADMEKLFADYAREKEHEGGEALISVAGTALKEIDATVALLLDLIR